MKTNILTLAITLTVGIILAGSLLMPVLSDATTTERTFTNEGAFYVELDPTDSYTIEYDMTTPRVIEINGEELTLPSTGTYTIMAIDDAILRYESDNTLQYKGSVGNLVGISNLNMTVSNGSITGTYAFSWQGTTNSLPEATYTKAYIASPDTQNLIMTKYNEPVKMLGDSKIFAFGQTNFSDNTLRLIKIEGSINDGITIELLDRADGEPIEGATTSDVVIDAVQVDGYNDLYTLNKITFNATDDTATAAVTFTAYIVPSSVTAELSQHLAPEEIAILNALPVLIIAALVLMAAGAIFLKRED